MNRKDKIKAHVVVPPLNFVDLLKLLAAFLLDTSLTVDGFNAAGAQAMSQEQERERDADKTAMETAQANHDQFMRRQLVRYQRFMSVLEQLRGKFRSDMAMLKRLDTMKVPHVHDPAADAKAAQAEAAKDAVEKPKTSDNTQTK